MGGTTARSSQKRRRVFFAQNIMKEEYISEQLFLRTNPGEKVESLIERAAIGALETENALEKEPKAVDHISRLYHEDGIVNIDLIEQTHANLGIGADLELAIGPEGTTATFYHFGTAWYDRVKGEGKPRGPVYFKQGFAKDFPDTLPKN